MRMVRFEGLLAEAVSRSGCLIVTWLIYHCPKVELIDLDLISNIK